MTPRTESIPESRLLDMLRRAWNAQASDLHLREDEPVVLRQDGNLGVVQEIVPARPEIEQFIYPMLTGDQLKKWQVTQELDSAFQVPGVCRIRLNLFIQRRRFCVAIRLLPERIPTMEELYLPEACERFCALSKGLVLVTGPTGSGKSTTLAAMLDTINARRACHILTIEDPIEFVYTSKKAMISQREIMDDTMSFGAALRHAFRQDPNVVLLGEMRDQETMQTAITLAETGHLTFSTLHTGQASQTISRIVDSFPPHHQEMVRVQLSNSLAGIVSQQLLPLKGRQGRVAAREVLVVARGIANLIRENKLEQIATAIQTGSSDGMFTMNHSLGHLYKNGYISYDVACQAAYDGRGFRAKYGKPSAS